MRKIPIAVALLIILFATAIWQRDAFQQAMYLRTGEEELLPQLRGMSQYLVSLTRKPPRLDRHVPVEHSGVNPFGINTFWQLEADPAKREQEAGLIAEAGFKWIRQEFTWEDIEIHGRGDFIDRRNDPDGIDAWAKYDHIVATAQQYDLSIIARLSNPPAWSRAAGNDNGSLAPPDDVNDYANFAAAVAARYQGRIRYYQLWNEPNIFPEWGENDPDPEAYALLLCAAYDAIKSADPDAIILSGPLAATSELSGRNLNDLVYLQRLYDAGAGSCFDILSMQGYGLWSGPTDHRLEPFIVNYSRVEYVRDLMVRNGDGHKSIWISEMNWNVVPEDIPPAYGRVTLDQQARWAPQAYQRAQEEWPFVGVINFWYFRRPSDDWEQAARPEAYFRMSTSTFDLQPVYQSMAEYATQQQAVLYPATHSPQHWGISWSDDGTTARLTFEGRSLTLLLNNDADATTVEICLDDGQCRQTESLRTLFVRQRSVSIHLDHPASLKAIVVRGRNNTPIWAALTLTIFGAGSFVIRSRRA